LRLGLPRQVIAFVAGLILIFQIFGFTTFAPDYNVTPFSWALSSGSGPDPTTTHQVDVSVAMKQTKLMSLLSIRNNGESTIHFVEVKNPDGAIILVKAKGWDGEQLDPSTFKISTDDRPLKRDGNLVLLIQTDNSSSNLQWSVADNIGDVLASGTVKERVRQSESKPIIQEEKEEQVKNQSTTDDNALILKVTDRERKLPVEGATVIIIDSSGKVVAGKTTDNKGEIKLIVSSGMYKVTIQADSYNKLVESLEVQGDVQRTFELTRTSSVTIRTTSVTN
jgi:hypothetical protein